MTRSSPSSMVSDCSIALTSYALLRDRSSPHAVVRVVNRDRLLLRIEATLPFTQANEADLHVTPHAVHMAGSIFTSALSLSKKKSNGTSNSPVTPSSLVARPRSTRSDADVQTPCTDSIQQPHLNTHTGTRPARIERSILKKSMTTL